MGKYRACTEKVQGKNQEITRKFQEITGKELGKYLESTREVSTNYQASNGKVSGENCKSIEKVHGKNQERTNKILESTSKVKRTYKGSTREVHKKSIGKLLAKYQESTGKVPGIALLLVFGGNPNSCGTEEVSKVQKIVPSNSCPR